MKTHELKISPEYFVQVETGKKKFELRYNDRGFLEGDFLFLREWDKGKYTGRDIFVRVTSILKEFEGLKDGWVIMSIKVEL